MVLGIPTGHDLHVLNSWVFYPCVPSAFGRPNSHRERADWPLNRWARFGNSGRNGEAAQLFP